MITVNGKKLHSIKEMFGKFGKDHHASVDSFSQVVRHKDGGLKPVVVGHVFYYDMGKVAAWIAARAAKTLETRQKSAEKLRAKKHKSNGVTHEHNAAEREAMANADIKLLHATPAATRDDIIELGAGLDNILSKLDEASDERAYMQGQLGLLIDAFVKAGFEVEGRGRKTPADTDSQRADRL